MPDPTTPAEPLGAVLEELLGSLPARLWHCLQPDHRNVDYDGDVARCPDCGLTSDMTRSYRDSFHGVIERRLRRELAAEGGGWRQEAVAGFHRQFGFYIGPTCPTIPPDQIIADRCILSVEEVAELFAEMAAGHPDRLSLYERACALFAERAAPPDRPPDPVKVAVELGDVDYVNTGGAVNWGIPLAAVFAEIHRANLTKVDDDGMPLVRDGKARKGPRYQPADIAGVLRAAAASPWFTPANEPGGGH